MTNVTNPEVASSGPVRQEGDGDARVVILDAGRATLELANSAQVTMIDEVEVGRPVSQPRGHRHRG